MRVRLRYFASLRDRLGAGEDRVVRAGTTAGTLWDLLVHEQPAIGGTQVRIAVNERYVERDHALGEGDEVAFFPPVSGGG